MNELLGYNHDDDPNYERGPVLKDPEAHNRWLKAAQIRSQRAAREKQAGKLVRAVRLDLEQATAEIFALSISRPIDAIIDRYKKEI